MPAGGCIYTAIWATKASVLGDSAANGRDMTERKKGAYTFLRGLEDLIRHHISFLFIFFFLVKQSRALLC
jgi:hypothetical protein